MPDTTSFALSVSDLRRVPRAFYCECPWAGDRLDGAVSSFLLPTTEGTTDDMTALRHAIKTARRPMYSAGNVVESGSGLRRRKLFEALEGSDGPSESFTAEEAVPPPAQVDNPARCETGAP